MKARLDNLKGRLGLTTEQLAERLGVHVRMVYKYHSGDRIPATGRLARIEAAEAALRWSGCRILGDQVLRGGWLAPTGLAAHLAGCGRCRKRWKVEVDGMILDLIGLKEGG